MPEYLKVNAAAGNVGEVYVETAGEGAWGLSLHRSPIFQPAFPPKKVRVWLDGFADMVPGGPEIYSLAPFDQWEKGIFGELGFCYREALG